MSKPAAKGRLGLELADSFSLTPGGACVTVTAIEENAAAAEAGGEARGGRRGTARLESNPVHVG